MIDNDRSGEGALLDFVRERQAGMAADTLPKLTEMLTKKEYAAVLLADDELPDWSIAEKVGVTRQTLHNWKHKPEFAALVGDNVGRIQAGMLKLAIAKKHQRVKALDDLHAKSFAVITARALRYQAKLGTDDPEALAALAAKAMFGENVPAEAATGLLVEQESVNNSGMKTVNWSVDTGLMKEIRALQEQAAKELGQWEENVNLKHGGMVRTIILEDD